MKTSLFILCLFFNMAFSPAYADSTNPVQGGAPIPAFYAPDYPVQQETIFQSAVKLDFGNYTSSGLLKKAWAALEANDLRVVQAYVQKIDELYAKQAKTMQRSLKDYASGSNDQIFKYWALNDVGTAWFILGKAYWNSNNNEEAAKAFNKVINEYSLSQCWDPHGWFWKPAFGARDYLNLLKMGLHLDFGDYASNTLVQKAWGALEARDLKAVKAYVDKIVELYGVRAREMQMGLEDYASGSSDQIFQYWALNDVGTAMLILGEAYRYSGLNKEAEIAYKKVINEYFYAQCWDPRGWFWKPGEAAQQGLGELI